MMANFPVPYRVTLGDLLPATLGNPVIANIALQGLDNNSKTIEAGDLFVACPGTTLDGRRFIDDAIMRGAVAVAYEQRDSAGLVRRGDCVDINRDAVTMIPVENLAQQLSDISARYFHAPAAQMACIGVTGTNGKTSCAFWIAQLLAQLGKTTGLIGTLGHQILRAQQTTALQTTGFTTPDAIRLQQLLAHFRDEGVTHTVMEVSSHSLDQGRVNALRYRTALFTNLSRDHLDYHGSMEQYGAAKARLFSSAGLQHAVINIDDAFGASLAKQITGAEVITTSAHHARAAVHVERLQMNTAGVRGELVTPWGRANLVAPVIGDFNLSNLLGVVAVLGAEGYALEQIAALLPTLAAVPGRLQRMSEATDDIAVYVDFAHTPDALEKILRAVRPYVGNSLTCVFGCGGDRDPGKRPLMGAVVTQLADRAIVTSDNPRSETPEAIIAAIMPTMDAHKTTVIIDRRDAIQFAIAHAQPGDVVIIAGKGHEDYQEVRGSKLPFSDALEAGKALAHRRECRT